MQLAGFRNIVACLAVIVGCAEENTNPGADHTAGDARAAAAPSGAQAEQTIHKLTGDVVGRMCEADADCGGGLCSMVDNVFRNYPGGYCSGICLHDEDCGDSGTCATGLPGSPGICFRKCAADADCDRDAYRCRKNVLGTGLQCLPGVRPLPDGTTGKACTADDDCGGAAMSCASQSIGANPTLFPGGYCSQACVESADCGAGGVCSINLAVIAMGSCYQACATAKDCRDGYTCRMRSQATIGGKDMATVSAGALVCVPTEAPTSDQDAGM